VVCSELNNRRQKKGESKINADLLRGSQEQVLADFYDQKMADLAPEVRSFVEDKLLTVSGYRDSVALENALSTPGVSQKDIDKLVDRRLVRREDRGGTQRLELTHDLLAGVVRTSRDSRRQNEAAEQERTQLLETQAKLRRSRLLLVAFALLTLFALVTAGWAFWERRQAVKATARAEEQERKAVEQTKRLATTAELLNNLQYQLSQKAQAVLAARNSADSKQALASLETTVKDVEATKAAHNTGTRAIAPAVMTSALIAGSVIPTQAPNPREMFTPACSLPFKGVRNPAIDDHCGIQGGSTEPADQAESMAKNNFCAATQEPETMTYQDFLSLQAQSVNAPRHPTDRKEVERLGEGRYVSYVALIDHAYFSNVDGENVNCDLLGNSPNNIGIALMSDSNDRDFCHSIRAYISPHYRRPELRPSLLSALGKPVRIRGQLFYDNNHVPCSVGAESVPKRASVWEIHPVYSIGICKMNDLDQCRATTDPADWTPLQ
jgi:hypothetical protein